MAPIPITKYIVSPIKRHLRYAFENDSMVQTLWHDIVRLKSKIKVLELIEPNFVWNNTRWLRDAYEAIREAEELMQRLKETKPNLKTRYQLSKEVEYYAFLIDELYNEKKFDTIPFLPIDQPSIYRSKLFPSRVLLLNQIMDALKDPSLNMMGIYGIGGVGKTTLVKEVYARSRNEELFDDVIMISVTRFPNLRRIQAEIAAFLGLKFDAEELAIRANQLYQRLKKAKLLIILDDVWQKLDLDAVGIPECQGCRLLVSSRSKDVLSSEMGSHKDFLVDVLSGEESWSLFRTIAPEAEDLISKAEAIEIAEQCAGLPLLIILVSVQLKNKEFYHLSVSGNEDLCERVHKVVETSFRNLPEEELKLLFLVCASFPRSNIQIQHLLIYCMGLRMFGTRFTIEEARETLFSLMYKLSYQRMLLDGYLHRHVKLHDVVCDVASRFQHFYKGASETRLRDWQDKYCKIISLTICSIHDLPTSLQCPDVVLFVLSCEDLCLEIPDLFFEGIRNLEVADFTGIGFATRLPSSLGSLISLNSLCFHRCRLDDISVIGELTILKFLSFAESEIVELPREIEALTQLRLLDLTNCSKLQVIPMGVIANLSSLEELYMSNSFVHWDEEDNLSLAELEMLSCLSSLEIQIVNPKPTQKFSSFYNKLRCCKIIIGKELGSWVKYKASRELRLIKLEASIGLVDAFKELLGGVEELYLDEVRGMVIVLDASVVFRELSHLCIKNDYDVQHLIELRAGYYWNAFPVLKSLHLDNLNCLEMICDGPTEMFLSFGKLETLKVRDCGKLKCLFSLSNAGYLWNLREMEVESCENMEALVIGGSENQFPLLGFLKLKNLPTLSGFCNKKGRAEKIGLLFQDKVYFRWLTSLELKNCKSLKYLFTRSNVKLLLQLERLEVNNCELVEEIIWHKESEEVEEGIDKVVSLGLKYVVLKKLKHLKRFSCGFPVEFTSLTELSIHECPAMEYFVPEISEKNTREGDENGISYNLDGKTFPWLTRLHIQNGYDSRHTITLIHDLNSLESLYFDEMGSLNASSCNKLKNLFSFSPAKCTMYLLDLEVQSCHSIEAIVGGQSDDEILELTQLRSLKLENLPHLIGFCKRKEGPAQTELLFNTTVSFPNLTSLVVEKCNSLKYVFTTSMVKCLVHLKKLQISHCELMEAIIQSNESEEKEDEIINTIVFCKLDTLSLYELPNVKMFGCGYEIEFLLLKKLSIECPAMKNFLPKYSDRNADEHLFSDLVTFSNLESLIVWNMNQIRYLWHDKFILSKIKSLNIANCSCLSVVFPVDAYRRIPKLEALHLSCCDGVEEIFPFEEIECGETYITEEFALRDVRIVNVASLKYVFPNIMAHSLLKLKQLEVHDCNLQVIIFEAAKDEKSQGITCVELLEMEVNSTAEVKEFPQLCYLKLKNLPHLAGFCNKREQGFGMQVSFPNLKGLELCECKNFKYVFTSTMINSFKQLEKLEVNNCELVEEILLSRQFDEVESMEKIVFPKLEYLSLEKLPNLKRFEFGYSVEFQSLKELSISYCPVLNNFVSKFVNNSDEHLFNEMVTFCNLERMKVSHTNSFKLWDERFPVDHSFLKLKSLRIEYCSNLSVVFPSNIYQRFRRLETLYLCCCSRVEEIYQYEGKYFKALNFKPFSLQHLEIRNLPSLKYIWSKDALRAPTFDYLQSVKVVSCKDLMFVFPKSIAHRLFHLQHLKISDSHMEFIIPNSNARKSNFIVPQMTVLQLENLYEIKNLYEGPYTFKCPKLKQFDIYGCDHAMNFYPEIKSFQLCGFEQVMKLGSQKIVRNLEELTLDDQGLKLILSVELGGVEFSKLKRVTLRSLEQESAPLLSSFLKRCSLKKLVVVESYLEEMLLGYEDVFELEHLEVVGDDNLKHILKTDNRVNPNLGMLRALNIEFCESLFNIAPSVASFENLTSLNISVCSKMTNLVTASTARSMRNLMVLKVSECPMMEELVVNNDVHGGCIYFYKLERLELYDLPTLKSFSSSNMSFDCPLLERVVVKQCFAMKNFCSGKVEAPKLHAIHFQDGQHWKGDLNATIASIHGQHK